MTFRSDAHLEENAAVRATAYGNARGQSLTEYLIVVLLIAVGVIVGIRVWSNSLSGKFENATEMIDSAGSKKPPAVNAGEATAERSGGAEEPDAHGGRTETTPTEHSGGGRSGGAKRGSSDLDKQVAELQTGVGETDSRLVDKIHIDWSTLLTIGGIIVALGVCVVFRKSRAVKQQNAGKKKKKKFSLGSVKDDEQGQVLVLGLLLCVGLMMISVTVANVGMMVAEKIQLQDTVDASAYSSAVVEARYMNLSAYINRAMIANYDMMAFDTALWAVMDADDHGMAVIVSFLYQVDAVLIAFPLTTAFGVDFDSVVDALRDYVHHPLHTLNAKFDDIFAQDNGSSDLNQYIELFNTDILSMYQGLLYAAMQASRYEVAREVAKKMDPDVVTTSVLGLGAEAMNYDELARAVDYVIRDPDSRDSPFKQFSKSFNDMAGKASDESDNPLLLAATTEASLDRFVAGKTRDGDDDLLRSFNFGHIIPFGVIETALDIECNIEEVARAASPLALFTDPLDCNADLNLIIGANMRDGFEDKHDQEHVPFISRRRMREVNFFGLDFKVSGTDGALGSLFKEAIEDLLGERGHTSGEKHNDVGNVANSTFGIGGGIDFARAAESFAYNGFKTCSLGTPIPSCGLNSFNIIEASTMIPVPHIPPLFVDDHWDGSTDDVEPVSSYQLIPPVEGNVTVVEYAAEELEAGVPKYDWKVDLDNVGFPNYIYPTTGAQQRPNGTKGGSNNNFLTGPSIAVVGTKAADKINGLHGLGIGNDYSMSAISRAQVYYVRNPNRPDEIPSLFNPHWVARLAPITADDTPPLLKEGLPFVASVGLPVHPTH
ncbi:MAG: pilus assembly protein TadG-related protein [Bdellovibrionota bacterium]